jgi:hypothetical protein
MENGSYPTATVISLLIELATKGEVTSGQDTMEECHCVLLKVSIQKVQGKVSILVKTDHVKINHDAARSRPWEP